ncbi:hypothetical protein [Methanosarcina sp. 2.H.A.1B.4]|uniref:hypothetical protein n=1 Tax=Methanosarcina sp. 2.H.A.1B.4 TaxID=1483600 RepID=UPI000620E9D8|nr:hypothetical protein [Methanosarcina sp. 2.H.A.1B.4]KKG07771.1 hypothetical protein EO92_04250 [Methanosarcina sp. 2.H.A.1B.4]
MPTINSVRIINAVFNNGRGTYDNFTLDPEGNGFVYELANGGGKTVLLLLMLQCVYPNSKLENNKPFKLMFEGGDKNRTTHAMIEWKLDKGIHNYSYAVTGICAKKKIAYDGSEKDELDYFNYVIFYNHSNEYDIRKIQLCKTYEDGSLESVVSYSDTQSLLKNLEKNKPQHCEVHVFNRKEEYMEFLKRLGIIKTELEIIRKINENENKLDTYFKRYDTSRKLFQDLLIPTTSECLKDKSRVQGLQSSEDSTDNIAESVFKFRDKILALKELQSNLGDYRTLRDEAAKLEHSVNAVIGVFQARDATVHEAAVQYRSYESAVQELTHQIADLNAQISEVEKEHKECEIGKQFNTLRVLESEHNLMRIELDDLIRTRTDIADRHNKAEYDWNFARATGKYVQIKERRGKVTEREEQRASLEKSNEELYSTLNRMGSVLFSRYSAILLNLQENYNTKKKEQRSMGVEKDRIVKSHGKCEEALRISQEDLDKKEAKLKKLGQQESDTRKQLSANPQQPPALFDVEEERKRTREDIISRKQDLENTKSESKRLIEEKHKLELKQIKVINQKESAEGKIKEFSQKMNEYDSKLKEVQEIFATYDTTDIVDCILKLEDESTRYTKEKVLAKNKLDRLKKRLEFIDKYGYDIIDDSIEEVKAKLGDTFKNAIYGMDHLKQLDEADRVAALQRIPWLPKAMFVSSNDLKSITNNPFKLAVSVQDSSVVIASIDKFNSSEVCSTGDIFVPHRDTNHYINLLSTEKAKAIIEKDVDSATRDIESAKRSIEKIRKMEYTVTSFKTEYVDGYPNGYESYLKDQLDGFNAELTKLNEALSSLVDQIRDTGNRFDHSTSVESALEKTISDLTKKEKLLDILYRIVTESSEVETQFGELKLLIPKYKKELESIDLHKTMQEHELQQMAECIKQLEKELNVANDHVEKFKNYADRPVDEMGAIGTEELHSQFNGVEEASREERASVIRLNDEIADHKARINELTKDIIEVFRIPMDTLEQHDPQTAYSGEYIASLEKHRNDLVSQHAQQDEKCRSAEVKHRVQKKEFDAGIKEYHNVSGREYIHDPDLTDSEEFKRELTRLNTRELDLNRSWSSLKRKVQDTDKVRETAQKEFGMFSVLEGEYGLSKITVNITTELKPVTEISKQIGERNESLKTVKNSFTHARQQLRETALELKVGAYYSDSFDVKFRDPESAQEANQTVINVTEYVKELDGKIQHVEYELEGLEKDENNIINLIMQCNRIYLGYLREFANASKIKTHEGTVRPMISTNLDACIYDEELAVRNVREYVGKILGNKDIILDDVRKMTTPTKLIECAVDMNAIRVHVLKVDIQKHTPQLWDNINASGGQINAMYMMFLAVLFSYIRKIVIDQSALATSKILIVDNPFGTTGSAYLWDDIWAILEKNNIQLICPTHMINPKIRSFFPKSYLLTNKFSVDNAVKVCIKEATCNEASVKRTKEFMYGQLTFDEKFEAEP